MTPVAWIALLKLQKLQKLQNQDDAPFGWLIQAAIVVIFFVLPIVRTIREKNKRAGGKPSARPPERGSGSEGRDLWRELLEGKPSQAPPRPPAPPSKPPPSAVRPRTPPPLTIPPTPPTPSAPARRAVPDSATQRVPSPAPPAWPVELEGAEAARRLAERAHPSPEPASRPRIADRKLETLKPQVDSSAAAALSSGDFVPARIEDPATLDDEMGRSWDASDEIGRAAGPPLRLGRSEDWRRAVLLSELLAPPLAVRGASFAWPGPPSALVR